VIEVPPEAERHTDRAGDPLEGLVNMFDLGIVLAVAFLLAALQAANLTGVLTDEGLVHHHGDKGSKIVVKKNEEIRRAKTGGKAVGHGAPVGTVYRLSDGTLVYVKKKGK
jgi:hypothetical protein